jgi:NiFe hydrogenase small subunit HydA
VLIDVINLAYHRDLMASAGQTAINMAKKTYQKGEYILLIEGGVPTAFHGHTGLAWTDLDQDVTFEEVVLQYAPNASQVVCIGQCSSYGGVSAAPPNPAQTKSIQQITGLTTINVAGCPPHPDWVVWVIAKLVAGQSIPLDSHGRPQELFPDRIHEHCQLRYAPKAQHYGEDGKCLMYLGCRGVQSQSKGECPSHMFNNGVNFCTIAGAPCFGCTNPNFPGNQSFFVDD